MSHTFSLPCGENAGPRQSTVETPRATLFLRDFCTPPFVDSLKPDVGLRAFARLPEREHQLLRTIAERPDSILTLAYTQQGVIVGQVTLVPAEDSWQGLTNTYEIAFEVSDGWRKSGIMRQLLKQVFELDCLEDLIIIGMGLSWHWDTAGLGMTRFAYRTMIERLTAHHGFAEYLTSDENIRMDPANIFLVRFGHRVATDTIYQFHERLLQSDTLTGM
ncbi:MAG TPA: GNAT family N-acetyltransferase [Ktedonobacteraceae bacterium]|jgi:GNAT superfamily N-acetyltransferase|nr:GNAT family N-acetyltransferase [Ktedonobacteraceae bacterium]